MGVIGVILEEESLGWDGVRDYGEERGLPWEAIWMFSIIVWILENDIEELLDWFLGLGIKKIIGNSV